MISRLDFMGCLYETLYCIDDDSARQWHRTLEVHIVMVSPQLAAHWLALMDPNQRELIPANVERIKAEVHNGAWKHLHNGACFGWSKDTMTLVGTDAKHRLTVIVQTGRTLPLTVTVQRDATVKDPSDTGVKRRASFVAGMSPKKAAVLTRVQSMFAGRALPTIAPSALQKLDVNFGKVVDRLLDITGAGRVKSTVLGTIVYAWSINPSKIDKFAKQVVTGLDITSKSSAAMKLRNALSGSDLDDAQTVEATSAQLLRVLTGTGPSSKGSATVELRAMRQPSRSALVSMKGAA